MKKLFNKNKIIYIAIALIILIGIISIFTFRLNFTLMYSDNIRIDVYLGKNYELEDIKKISEETFGTNQIIYQEIETFHDAVAITVKEASDEQISTLKTKLIEKYELSDSSEFLDTTKVAHLRGRDIVKPYIVPMIIVTLIILAYVGVRYSSLGILKTIFTLLLRQVISEALLLSIIAIARIPIGIYTMPVAIILYIIVTMYTIMKYQNELDKNKEKEDKK